MRKGGNLMQKKLPIGIIKGAKAGNYEDAKAMMKYIMAAESRRLYDRMSGDKLSENKRTDEIINVR